MDTVIPTAVNTAVWRVPCVFSNARGLDQNLYTSFYFTTSGSFEPGYSPFDFNIQSYEALSVYFADFELPVDWGQDSAWTINTPAGLKQVIFDYFFIQPSFLTPTLVTQCVPIFLRTATHSRRGVGRVSWAWVLNSDFDGDYTTDACLLRLAPLVSFYLNGFAVGGVSFIPSVWSRKDNVFRPITKVEIGDRASWNNKRSPWKRDPRTPLDLPLVW